MLLVPACGSERNRESALGHLFSQMFESTLKHYRLGELGSNFKKKLAEVTIKEDSWMKSLLEGEFNQKRSDAVHVFVSLLGDEIMGWCTVHHTYVGFSETPGKETRCFEFNVCVSPKYRGKGVSTEVLSFAKKSLKPYKRAHVAFPFDKAGEKAYKKVKIRCFEAEEDLEYTPLWE